MGEGTGEEDGLAGVEEEGAHGGVGEAPVAVLGGGGAGEDEGDGAGVLGLVEGEEAAHLGGVGARLHQQPLQDVHRPQQLHPLNPLYHHAPPF